MPSKRRFTKMALKNTLLQCNLCLGSVDEQPWTEKFYYEATIAAYQQELHTHVSSGARSNGYTLPLPPEIILAILEYLPPKELISFFNASPETFAFAQLYLRHHANRFLPHTSAPSLCAMIRAIYGTYSDKAYRQLEERWQLALKIRSIRWFMTPKDEPDFGETVLINNISPQQHLRFGSEAYHTTYSDRDPDAIHGHGQFAVEALPFKHGLTGLTVYDDVFSFGKVGLEAHYQTGESELVGWRSTRATNLALKPGEHIVRLEVQTQYLSTLNRDFSMTVCNTTLCTQFPSQLSVPLAMLTRSPGCDQSGSTQHVPVHNDFGTRHHLLTSDGSGTATGPLH
ncbi:hypothetical protein KEM52_002210 [Ascosphaera acerosa]|nr:hypothetical protein KEM52_002210 [Ascosphaera acerosa]